LFFSRRGIYKDTVGSTEGWSDYQLRPNICVAMAVAPELFQTEHAQKCLEMVEKILVAPLGMRTLDPSDWNYRPNYLNQIDSEDFHTSKGFNYHQGPEWLWCLGYFLRAKTLFGLKNNIPKKRLSHEVLAILRPHRDLIQNSVWKGLPELTNHNGSDCKDGCPTQAWSMATILDALFDLQKL
jgi:glycogen debranching enzyme